MCNQWVNGFSNCSISRITSTPSGTKALATKSRRRSALGFLFPRERFCFCVTPRCNSLFTIAFYRAHNGKVRQSTVRSSVAESCKAELTKSLFDVLYPALWDSDKPKPHNGSLKSSGVLSFFPALGIAEREKLRQRRSGQKAKLWPMFSINDDTLAPAVNNKSHGLIHVRPVWEFAAFLVIGECPSELNEKAVETLLRHVRIGNQPALKTRSPICWRRLPASCGRFDQYRFVLFPQTPDKR